MSGACHRLTWHMPKAQWQEAEGKYKTGIPLYSSREQERVLEKSLGSHHRGLKGQVRQRWMGQWGCSLNIQFWKPMQVTGQEAWQNLGRDEVEWQDVALDSGRRWMLFPRPYTKKRARRTRKAGILRHKTGTHTASPQCSGSGMGTMTALPHLYFSSSIPREA